MAELFRHTDEDGRTLTFLPIMDSGISDLLAWTGRDGAAHGDRAIRLPEVDGRRLLAALLGYYEPEWLLGLPAHVRSRIAAEATEWLAANGADETAGDDWANPPACGAQAKREEHADG